MADRQKALFLDRDGVINVDYGYVYKIEDCVFIDGIFDLCRAAKELGYKLIIATNQAGIAKGYYTETDFLKFMDHIRKEFIAQDCPLDDIFYCPYHKDGTPPWREDSPDRKPAPGMLKKAAEKHNLDLARSALVGDRESDILAGINAGVGLNILIDGRIKSEIIECLRARPG
ncbi:MAG: HAD family hydrolase [Desulfovibrio sp.]|nr:HAD family hydrolase [Desulfovibrio sp.]